MHGMESQRRWDLFKSVIILILTLLISFFQTSYSLIPLIPVPGIPKLYPQHHLILSFTIQRQPFVDFMNGQCEFYSIALDESTDIIQPNVQFLLEVLQIILKLLKSYWKCAQ